MKLIIRISLLFIMNIVLITIAGVIFNGFAETDRNHFKFPIIVYVEQKDNIMEDAVGLDSSEYNCLESELNFKSQYCKGLQTFNYLKNQFGEEQTLEQYKFYVIYLYDMKSNKCEKKTSLPVGRFGSNLAGSLISYKNLMYNYYSTRYPNKNDIVVDSLIERCKININDIKENNILIDYSNQYKQY